MVQVFDDLLPPTLVDRIERTICNDQFQWFALNNISLGGQPPKREFQFPEGYRYLETAGMTKPFWSFGKWYDPYDMYMMSRMIIDYVCEAKQIPMEQFIRSKANMLTPHPNQTYNNETCFHYPHIDFYNTHHVVVYYVNDSDGDTIIFNEKWNPSDDNGGVVPLTIKQRISPKRGRIVYFDGLHYHTSQNPINTSERVILNLNFG